MKKFIILSFVWGSILFGQQIDYNTQIKNKPGVMSDVASSTISLSSLCSTANSQGLTLVITKNWVAATTQTNNCNNLVFAGGSFQAAVNATLTVTGDVNCPLTQTCFIPGQGTVLLTGASTGIYANWFGLSITDSDSTGTNTSAMVAAYIANPFNLLIACGSYSFQSGITFSTSGSSIHGINQNCVHLNYTGTNALTYFITIGSNSGVTNLSFGDMFISGNSHVSNVLQALQLNQNSIVQNLQLKNASSRCLDIQTSVGAQFNTIGCTNSTGMMTTIPNIGIEVITSNAISLNAVVAEYMNNTTTSPGIKLTSCIACTISGGGATSESNGVNLEIDSGSLGTHVFNVDYEAPCTANITNAGLNTVIEGGLIAGISTIGGCSPTPPSIHFTSTATNGKISRIVGDTITVDSGAKWTRLEGNNLGNNFGSITTDISDAGTLTIFDTNEHCCGAGQGLIPNKNTALTLAGEIVFNSQLFATLAGSINSCVDSGSNNHIACALVDPTTSNAISEGSGGLVVSVNLEHTLQAGSNDFTFNGVTHPIVSTRNGGSIAAAYLSTGAGAVIVLREYGGIAWMDVSQ